MNTLLQESASRPPHTAPQPEVNPSSRVASRQLFCLCDENSNQCPLPLHFHCLDPQRVGHSLLTLPTRSYLSLLIEASVISGNNLTHTHPERSTSYLVISEPLKLAYKINYLKHCGVLSFFVNPHVLLVCFWDTLSAESFELDGCALSSMGFWALFGELWETKGTQLEEAGHLRWVLVSTLLLVPSCLVFCSTSAMMMWAISLPNSLNSLKPRAQINRSFLNLLLQSFWSCDIKEPIKRDFFFCSPPHPPWAPRERVDALGGAGKQRDAGVPRKPKRNSRTRKI